MTTLPKAVLYHYPISIWSSVALLALEEKGYGKDEVDLKQVDLSRGENYDVSYLRINPKATVPALVVPLEDTLAGDVESRYRAITDTKTIVEFLDKSRSAISRTHTTSSAPAPSLAPATVAFMDVSDHIITLLHSETADPNHLRYFNVSGEVSLRDLAKEVLPGLVSRRQVLEKHLNDAAEGSLRVSDKVVKLWGDKKERHNQLYDVLKDADIPTSGLDPVARQKRDQFFQIASKAWKVDLKEVLLALSKDIIGPFTLGDHFSIADVHLTCWLGRVMHLSGVTAECDGKTAIERVEKRIGMEGLLPSEGEGGRRKLEVFWEAVKERRSWQMVYGAGLH